MDQVIIEKIITAVLAEAKLLNIPITVSVVDLGGHLIALQRMEGCSYFGIDASQKKAVTASQLKAPTHILPDITQKFPELQKAFDKNPSVLVLRAVFQYFKTEKLSAA